MAARNRYYGGPASSNFDGMRFFLAGHQGATGRDVLKWNLTHSPRKWPRRVALRPFPPPPQKVAGQHLNCTWIGHSTALIQVAGLNILTDPFFSTRASPLSWIGPKRVRKPGIILDALPPIDIVLVSHNHYDHLDLSALRTIIGKWSPTIVTPLGNGFIIRKAGKNASIIELDWWQSTTIGPVEIIATPALHWSKRTLQDRNHALWCAFALNTPAGLIYFAADTGYGDGSTFREIKARLGAPRLSLLPIGAYEPRWFMRHEHMNPEEAVKAHLELESATSIAIHHGTVQLTEEAIDAPANALAEALLKSGVEPGRFRILEAGESLSPA